LKARIWIAQGRLAEALAWARERGLSADNELSYLGEFEHITLVRTTIASYRSGRDERSIHQAMSLLERVLRAAQAGERIGSEIEILVLQALAHEALADISGALTPLTRALALAEPEGYVRVLLDEGEPMHGLLRHAAAEDGARSYAQRLLVAFDALIQPTTATAGLVDALTPREIEILRLIAAGMRNQQIADQLYISLATVKRHIANAYGKLGVGHRTEAVARATELKLL
jgi:LuxR family maltose regulon positive regulatory protein